MGQHVAAASPALPAPMTKRSEIAIQANIDRAVARLRDLRERQADVDLADRTSLALKIQNQQGAIDQLYEEKRVARALAMSARLAPQRRTVRPADTGVPTEGRGQPRETRVPAGLFVD